VADALDGRKVPAGVSLSAQSEGTNMTRILALAVALALTTGAVSNAAPQCVKGKPCGNTCIAKGKVCHVTTPSAFSFSSAGPYKGLKYVGH
jgi:hypothetical protein